MIQVYCPCYNSVQGFKRGAVKMLRYKFDVLASFKAIGYTSYKLRKEKILGEATIQQLRNGE